MGEDKKRDKFYVNFFQILIEKLLDLISLSFVKTVIKICVLWTLELGFFFTGVVIDQPTKILRASVRFREFKRYIIINRYKT